jgi:hypothetical protein
MSIRRRRSNTVLVVGAVVMLAGVIVYSTIDRRGAANAVGDAIRAMPGVSAAEVRYENGIDVGAHFDLEVTLSETASDTQAAAVGQTFVDRMRAAYFPDFEVNLDVAYKANPDSNAVVPGSQARFGYDFDLLARGGPSSSDVAGSLAMWLHIAQSPATVGVSLIQPGSFGQVTPREITVFLAPSVTDAAITALIRAHPDLATATWAFDIPSPNRFGHRRSCRVRGPFPSQQRRDLWRQIVDQIGSADARASTDTVDVHAGIPPTSVEIDLDFGPSELRQFEDAARAVTSLLPGLGLPIAYRLFGRNQHVEFTLGGCDRPDPRYPPSALENELRGQYQHC